MSTNFHYFPNIGVLEHSFAEDELFFLKKEIEKIKLNFTEATPSNEGLVGNIVNEYQIIESHDYLEKILLPFVDKFDKEFNYNQNLNYLNKNVPIKLEYAWVNFQKKYEFNPNHNHRGCLSFVIWINIPYYIDDEYNQSPGKYSNKNCAGNFEFQYTNTLGQICSHTLPADKTFENKMIMFPSKLIHCVYPFFSSNDYRISVSGNFILNV